MKNSLKNILKVVRVLYIDDKNNVPKTIQNTLKIVFKHIFYTNNFSEAMNIYNEKHPDIIISEVYTNDNNGSILPLLHEIREYNPLIPIIITASHKEEEILFDAIRLQPIDFLVKPLEVNSFIYPLNKAAQSILRHGNIIVPLNKESRYNYINKTIQQNTQTISLTKNESRLLEFLISNDKKTLSKEEIEFYIWGEEYVSESAFKSLLKRLRDKIGNNIIKNSPGLGYSLKSH